MKYLFQDLIICAVLAKYGVDISKSESVFSLIKADNKINNGVVSVFMEGKQTDYEFTVITAKKQCEVVKI